MIEAQFEYKCRRCGCIFYNPCCSPEHAKYILINIAMSGKEGNYINRGGRVFMYETHQCNDEGICIADLLGYIIVDTEEIFTELADSIKEAGLIKSRKKKASRIYNYTCVKTKNKKKKKIRNRNLRFLPKTKILKKVKQ